MSILMAQMVQMQQQIGSRDGQIGLLIGEVKSLKTSEVSLLREVRSLKTSDVLLLRDRLHIVLAQMGTVLSRTLLGTAPTDASSDPLKTKHADVEPRDLKYATIPYLLYAAARETDFWAKNGAGAEIFFQLLADYRAARNEIAHPMMFQKNDFDHMCRVLGESSEVVNFGYELVAYLYEYVPEFRFVE